MISLREVSKTYDAASAPAVESLTLEILSGEIVVLVGPSGCGKTTVLKMINRLVEPTSGDIEVAGTPIGEGEPHLLRRSIGYVIQQVGLFPHWTVRRNIATVPELLGWSPQRISDRTGELARLVGLDESMLDRYPGALSGGQQQRVGVARALAADPPVLLMDEPFGAVDPIVRQRLQAELVDLQKRLRKTIVFVTHDIEEAIKLGDRIVILNVGGVLEQQGSPAEILSRPSNRFVEDFIGAERNLQRLALRRVAEVRLKWGPMVEVSTTPEAAREAAAREGTEWVGLLSDGVMAGWVPVSELPESPSLEGLEPRPFGAVVSRRASLRQTVDAMVGSSQEMAVVAEDDYYCGLVDFRMVSEALGSQRGSRAGG
ncbi:MAG: ATP-binding cassette domain-containing protein [Actinomycetia bacterium]|nr:ATP-binding cassette domain-containing protein [Actinomycetes bacterium]